MKTENKNQNNHLLSVNNLIIAGALDKKVSTYRAFKSHIYVDKNETIVTDGAILLRVNKPDLTSDEFPEIEGADTVPADRPYWIDRETALNIAKSLKKNNSSFPIIQCAAEHKNGTVYIVTVDNNIKPTLHPTTPINDDNLPPNYDNAIPTGNDPVSVIFKVDTLYNVLSTLKKMNCKGVKLTVYDHGKKIKAIKIKSLTDSGQAVSGLIMPGRFDDKQWDEPVKAGQ